MHGAETLESVGSSQPLRTVGDKSNHFFPGLDGSVEILGAERPHDAKAQNRLRMRRINFKRTGELGECTVRVVELVIRHSEVGANLNLFRIQSNNRLIPGHRFFEPTGVEIEIAEIDTHLNICLLYTSPSPRD